MISCFINHLLTFWLCSSEQQSDQSLFIGCSRSVRIRTRLQNTLNLLSHLLFYFSVYVSVAGLVISEGKKISFCSKFYQCDWPNKVCVYELICPLCYFLGHAIIVFCCCCSLAAIVYTFRYFLKVGKLRYAKRLYQTIKGCLSLYVICILGLLY